MNQEEFDDICKNLDEKYYMIPKNWFWGILGGVIAFFAAAGFISYRAVIDAIESTGAKIALDEIENYRILAMEKVKSITSANEIYQSIPIRLQAVNSRLDRLDNRISGIKLTAGEASVFGTFSCGGQAVANDPFVMMVGSKDGTDCGIMNQNWGRKIGLEVPLP